MICKLCRKEAELQNSHIIPEHIYGDLYDAKHRYSGITIDGKSEIEQKGLRERLLCRECEQLLNDKYEKYFDRFWIKKSALPDTITADSFDIKIENVCKFKLYYLSILFRASVSTLGTFAGVALGKHENRIRKMLISESDYSKYNIFGAVICNKGSKVEKRIIVPPSKKYYNGHAVFQMIFAGCAWYIKISSYRSRDIENICLRPDGQLQLTVERMQDFAEIVKIHQALNASEKGKAERAEK